MNRHLPWYGPLYSAARVSPLTSANESRMFHWRRPVSSALLSALLPAHLLIAQAAVPDPELAVTVDSSRHEVVIAVGPFRLASMKEMMEMMAMPGMEQMDHDAMMPQFVGRFPWPVQGMGRGFRLEITDATGKKIPQRFLHHLQIINGDRRQLLLPLEEKIMAIGRETRSLMLPQTIGMPLTAGSKMRIKIMWHNETAEDLDGVRLTLRIRYSPANLVPTPTTVLPISIDVADSPAKPNTFTIPPGDVSVSREFIMPVSGRLLALSGHMHDWGAGLMLQEVESGKVLADFVTTMDSAGRITHMPRKLYGIAGAGLRLRAQRRYRIVARYHNPTGAPIAGAMGHLDGLIQPDDLRRWPVRVSKEMAYLTEGLDSITQAPLTVTTPAPAGDGHQHQHD